MMYGCATTPARMFGLRQRAFLRLLRPALVLRDTLVENPVGAAAEQDHEEGDEEDRRPQQVEQNAANGVKQLLCMYVGAS